MEWEVVSFAGLRAEGLGQPKVVTKRSNIISPVSISQYISLR